MIIRRATAEEFQTVIGWTKDEGWNPGLDDLDAFRTADPGGFLIGIDEGEIVSSVSVVRYGGTYGFLGFYIVRPDRRGTGAGLATWHAGMDRLEGRTVGLDGVPAQQDNYRKSGFSFRGRNIRFSGTVDPAAPDDPAISPASAADIPDIIAYDRAFFPDDRSAFMTKWIAGTPTRHSCIYRGNDGISGLGTIRQCHEGFKIGPLFADTPEIADALFRRLTQEAGRRTVFLDVPETNGDSLTLAAHHGMTPVFETARMYRGSVPDIAADRTFGVTTFELG